MRRLSKGGVRQGAFASDKIVFQRGVIKRLMENMRNLNSRIERAQSIYVKSVLIQLQTLPMYKKWLHPGDVRYRYYSLIEQSQN